MDDEAKKLAELQLASDIRKFEIGLFWQRSLFFWGLIAATFLAYANIKDFERDDQICDSLRRVHF